MPSQNNNPFPLQFQPIFPKKFLLKKLYTFFSSISNINNLFEFEIMKYAFNCSQMFEHFNNNIRFFLIINSQKSSTFFNFLLFLKTISKKRQFIKKIYTFNNKFIIIFHAISLSLMKTFLMKL